MDIREQSIDNIGLSVRSYNGLRRGGIHTVGQMLVLDEEKLYKIRNIGKQSAEEILGKIAEYLAYAEEGRLPDEPGAEAEQPAKPALPETPEMLYSLQAGRAFVEELLQEKQVSIDALEYLPARALNLLSFSGYTMLHQVVFMDESALLQIPKMDSDSASKIRLLCDDYLQKNGKSFLKAFELEKTRVTVFDMLAMPEYQETILAYVKANDRTFEVLGLSTRPVNQLHRNGFHMLSDILFISKKELDDLPAMGNNSVAEILQARHDYLAENEKRIMAYCGRDQSVLLEDSTIRDMILHLYDEIGFGGFSLGEMQDRLHLPEGISTERLKKIIGGLLAEKELEYVDFRCYRLYCKFADALRECTTVDERARRFILKKLNGATLEEIGQEDGNVTRERVRQIIKKNIPKVSEWNLQKNGQRFFDEDYYSYLFENYAFDKKEAAEWLSIPDSVFCYFDMMDIKQGKKPIEEALGDREHFDAGMLLKIKNYFNRNRVFLNGEWVEKKRESLENIVVRELCKNDVSFDDFVKLYNDFLEQHEIPFDEKIYYSQGVLRTRENRLSDSRLLLWKFGKSLRYYDIDSRDYTELLEELSLEDYENVEISTLKFFDSFPELMAKYDIRDQYELHNLLKKIVKAEDYPGLSFGRMPMLTFGMADRTGQLLALITEHAPVTFDDLQKYSREEYGYEAGAIVWNDIVAYYHDGIFTVDQPIMPPERRKCLMEHLPNDFYYISEIIELYQSLFPGKNPEEVNSFNLRQMGFTVLSKYVVQHFSTIDAFFRHMLTSQDTVDLTAYRRRFSSTRTFSNVLCDLKRNLEIIEYAPNKLISLSKLESSGVSRQMLQSFCDDVYNIVGDDTYFSAASLRQDDFQSELYDLGFDDCFYANVLLSDERFSSGIAFGSIILYKGATDVTIQSFESSLIRQAEKIDAYDLMNLMTDRYGCKIQDKIDLVYKVAGTEIYYDSIMDVFYANDAAYTRDLNRGEW